MSGRARKQKALPAGAAVSSSESDPKRLSREAIQEKRLVLSQVRALTAAAAAGDGTGQNQQQVTKHGRYHNTHSCGKMDHDDDSDSDGEMVIDIRDAIDEVTEETTATATCTERSYDAETAGRARKTAIVPSKEQHAPSLSTPPSSIAARLERPVSDAQAEHGRAIETLDSKVEKPSDLVPVVAVHHTLDTKRFACSVECCPERSQGGRTIVVGTYQLDEASKTRAGDLQLYDILMRADGSSYLNLADRLEMPTGGILDCKACART